MTGFSKAKVCELVNGISRYNRDVVNSISDALNISPYELLMNPEDAHAIKTLRALALTIVSTTPQESSDSDALPSDVRKFRK